MISSSLPLTDCQQHRQAEAGDIHPLPVALTHGEAGTPLPPLFLQRFTQMGSHCHKGTVDR